MYSCFCGWPVGKRSIYRFVHAMGCFKQYYLLPHANSAEQRLIGLHEESLDSTKNIAMQLTHVINKSLV